MVQPDDDELIFINGMIMQSPARRAGPVGVRVRRADKSSKRLTELAGVISAQVRLAEPLAVLDHPLKAAGQAARGSHGVNVTLKTISRGDSGDVTLSADVKLPLDIQMQQVAGGINMNGGIFAGQVVIQGQGAIRIGPGGIVAPPTGQTLAAGATDYQGLSLEDDKGRRFAATKGVVEMSQFGPDGATLRVSATFRPADKGTEPHRLVFTANRPTTIDVPFLVKDIPLP
jgi:hypothetical protein